MSHPAYIREHARKLRTEKHMSIDEIAECVALPKTTVYYWVKDLPLGRDRRWTEGRRKGTEAMQAKFRRLREDAYAQGVREFDVLARQPTFVQFVVLYIAEGYKRDRNQVSICNSDDRVMALATGWLRLLGGREPSFSLQYHADQDLDEIRAFWGEALAIEPEAITLLRKTNSGQLSGRIWRSAHGVLTARVSDTLLRARLQAWIDRVRGEWRLDSALVDGA